MITKQQIESLAKNNHIDGFTIAREYLQLLFLSHLYQQKKADRVYFKGGTAIRLLFSSPRFSEDLDFSTSYPAVEIRRLIKAVEKAMAKELPELRTNLIYTGKNGLRFRIRYQSADFKYPLTIRLDFNRAKSILKTVISPLVSQFPIVIFPLICHLSEQEILAEKICALAGRNKGRDFYDVWYLLEKGIPLNQKLLNRKLREIGTTYQIEFFIKKIKSYPIKKLNQDLTPFLPKPQRKIIPLLKKRLVEKIKVL